MGVFPFLTNDLGIDLGTANSLVYVRGRGLLIEEPSVVALDKVTKGVLAIGSEAKRMLGRTPGEIEAIRPMKDGVIADFDLVEQMLKFFIKKVQKYPSFFRPRAVIGVPSGITEVEKRAVVDSAESAGVREVYLVAEPMASAIGMGIPVNEPSGNMVIDIGGGTAEIAVLALFGMVCDMSVRIAGDEMDEAIVSYLKKTYNLLVGESTAEQIKIQVGSAFPLEDELEMEVKGRDL
ncbi:MAG: rod shape-determining protein, partial [Chitinispirillia bacterium]